MRAVITTDVGGISQILRDDVIPDNKSACIWRADSADPLGSSALADQAGFPDVAAGQVSFRIVSLPPHAQIAELLRGGVPGLDENGFHKTPTIDFVTTLDGAVELLLDNGSVRLEPGDVVVQRATNHAWRNHGETPIRLLVTFIGVPHDDGP